MANLIPLSEVTEFIKNGLSVKQDESAGGLPITRIETISHWEINPSKCGYAGLQLSDVSDRLLKEGDILFSHINSLEHLGKTAIYEGCPPELVHGMNLLSIRPDKDKVEPRYLLHLLRSNPVHAQVMRAANKSVNQASVSATNVKKIQVCIPRLEEQKRIAKILDAADALRAKRRESLAQLDALLQSTFLDLFGDPVSNPKGWKLCSLGSMVERLEGGKNIAEVKGPSKNKVLKVSAVTYGVYRPEESKYLPEDYVFPDSYIVRDGDLLISRANTSELIGATAYVWQTPENMVLPDKIWRFVWKKGAEVEPLYLYQLSKTAGFRDQLSKRASGTSGSMKNIAKPKLLGMQMPIPPLEAQQRFVSFLTGIEGQKRLLAQHLGGLDELFWSLQQRAFSGEL